MIEEVPDLWHGSGDFSSFRSSLFRTPRFVPVAFSSDASSLLSYESKGTGIDRGAEPICTRLSTRLRNRRRVTYSDFPVREIALIGCYGRVYYGRRLSRAHPLDFLPDSAGRTGGGDAARGVLQRGGTQRPKLALQ